MSNFRFIKSLFWLSVLYRIPLFSDALYLLNGDTLHGTLIECNKGKIEFKGEEIGKIRLRTKGVQTLTTEEKVTVVFFDDTIVEGCLVTGAPSGFIYLNGQEIDFQDIKRIATPDSPDPYPLTGRVATSYKANFGNTESTDLKVSGHLSKSLDDRSDISAKLSYVHETKDKETSKRNGKLTGKYTYDLSRRIEWYYKQKFSFDDKKDIDFQTEESLGLTYLLFYHPRFEFYYSVGLGRVDTFYEEALENYEGDFTFVFGYGVWWDFFCKWRCSHDTEFTSSIQGFDYFRIDSTTMIKVPFNAHWDFALKYEVEFRSEPPNATTETTDHSVHAEIGYSF